jgi:hypothetical protein
MFELGQAIYLTALKRLTELAYNDLDRGVIASALMTAYPAPRRS